MNVKEYKTGLKRVIEEYLQKHNLSLYAFSKQTGINYHTLKNMVNETSSVLFDDLFRLSHFMGYKVHEFFAYLDKLQ